MSPKILLIVGLSLNTLGALILILPNINPWKPLSNQYILHQKDEGGKDPKFIQVQDLVSMATSLSGFILLAIGFVLELIGTILT
jgi:hypothetical protein